MKSNPNLKERKIGEIFIKRCRHCWTRTFNRYEQNGTHRCLKCGKINAIKGE